jgi:hypothetical protein
MGYKMKYYIGIKVGRGRYLFQLANKPSYMVASHGYDAIIGPFQTKRGARFMQRYGQGNPHCQTIKDAERLAKKYQ